MTSSVAFERLSLLAFDVGVGKTYTALAVIARARQEGWVRRPVILVPSSLVHDDILCTPDYHVEVIGSKARATLETCACAPYRVKQHENHGNKP
jgi:hypothetical protein